MKQDNVPDITLFENLSITFFQRVQLFIKYVLDRILAFILLILLLPLFLIIALLVYLDDGWPIFFVQQRVGLNGRIFKMYKFRTFKIIQENKDIHTYKGDPRITRFGIFLRETSLDELPQLFNILLGDMSFVGPRPNLPEQYQQLTHIQKKRTLIKPGITGLAQINGRNTIPWEKRIIYDLIYIKHYSLLLDIYIVLKTPLVVIRREGVWEKK
ncbi:MAG: sugar transferase [Candidatus Calescibacterium sp.]|nr:sugar transferase [Candidatus Calescibacterium sp.]MCX7971997.1 sugar transferase [bacterium]MDW8195485.1 sugar transferase [Candidatus Calescibacterium sp.]